MENKIKEIDYFFNAKTKRGKIKLRLNIQKNGFALWDENGGQWIMDASEIVNNSQITLTSEKASKEIHTDIKLKRINDETTEILKKVKRKKRK